MLRIQDILKKYREDKKKLDLGSNRPEAGPLEEPDVPLKNIKDPGANNLSIASAINKELSKINSTNINELYLNAVTLARQVYSKGLSYDEATISAISGNVEKIVDLLSAGNKDLLKLCLVDYPHSEDFLYYHAVNVAIIAIRIGVHVSYDRSRLIDLGIGAFIHDIGIIKCIDIINQNAVLKKEELDKIKEHPMLGWEALKKFPKGITNDIYDIVRQEHERLDGSGYPVGLKGEQIIEPARIVGLSDVYEALLHKRPYRARFTPFETIKMILGNKNSFDHKLVKVLIERVGIFPVCTMVRLSTKEIAIVLKENPELPLRPKVNIIIDAYGKDLKEQKEIDLAENSMIYIEECLKHY